MALNSSDVSAGDDILASQYNDLRQDVREQNCDTQTRYYSFPPVVFQPKHETYDYTKDHYILRNTSSLTEQLFWTSINLPDGATITNINFRYYRSNASTSISLKLYSLHYQSSSPALLSQIDGDVTSGWDNNDDSTILQQPLNNELRYYYFLVSINPNGTNVNNVICGGVVVTYTITKGLP